MVRTSLSKRRGRALDCGSAAQGDSHSLLADASAKGWEVKAKVG
jgi:hypothetical protein